MSLTRRGAFWGEDINWIVRSVWGQLFEHKTPDRVPAATMQAVETAWEKMQHYFQVETADEVMDIPGGDTRVMVFHHISGLDTSLFNAKGEVVHTHPLDSPVCGKMETVWSITTIPSKGLLNMLRQWKPHGLQKLAQSMLWLWGCKAFLGRHQDKQSGSDGLEALSGISGSVSQESFYMLMAEIRDGKRQCWTVTASFTWRCIERDAGSRGWGDWPDRPVMIMGRRSVCCSALKMWDEYFAENTKKLVQLAHKYNCFTCSIPAGRSEDHSEPDCMRGWRTGANSEVKGMKSIHKQE